MKDPFGEWLGYRLEPAGPGVMPTTFMEIGERHLSAVGVAHGGAIYSLVDYAFGAGLIFSQLREDQVCSTIQLDMHYLAPVVIGSTLTVTPSLLQLGRSVARIEGKVIDQDGRCVAFATGSFNIYPKKTRLDRTLAFIDALHRDDPDGAELQYAERMTARLWRFERKPSRHLQIAARAQHLCRWRIARSDYPEGKAGYKRWRKDEAKLHAQLVGECMEKARYDADDIARVQLIVQKKKLKADPDSQLIEDVACLVFLEFELEAFAARHEEEKLIDILRKTWAKMSSRGHEAALELLPGLPPHLAGMVDRAVG